MSDHGRKNFSDKIGDAVQPDSSKSTLDRVGDNLTGASDKLNRDAIPDSQKSTTQSLADKASREKDHATGGTIGDKIKHVVGLDKHKESDHKTVPHSHHTTHTTTHSEHYT